MGDIGSQQHADLFSADDDLSRSTLYPYAVAVAAHQLRNPLAALSSTLQLVMLRSPADAPTADAYEVMTQEIQRMVAIIDDMVAFASEPAKGNDAVDLVALIKDVVADGSRQLEQLGIEVHRVLEVASCPIIAGAGEFGYVFRYLLRYLAVTAGEGSDLYLSARSVTETSAAGKTQQVVQCRLAHTPPDAEEQRYSGEDALAHSAMPGAAMGISLCQAIVKFYGCRLQVGKDDQGRYAASVVVPVIAEALKR